MYSNPYGLVCVLCKVVYGYTITYVFVLQVFNACPMLRLKRKFVRKRLSETLMNRRAYLQSTKRYAFIIVCYLYEPSHYISIECPIRSKILKVLPSKSKVRILKNL